MKLFHIPQSSTAGLESKKDSVYIVEVSNTPLIYRISLILHLASNISLRNYKKCQNNEKIKQNLCN